MRIAAVGKGDNGKKRKIKPQLSLDMNVPVKSKSLAYGDQSPDYIAPPVDAVSIAV
jgi:hypothetical protein